eukprot:12109002-Alexandrium_andersonii.AAC.1
MWNIRACAAAQHAETCRRRQRTCRATGLPGGNPKVIRPSPKRVGVCATQGQKGEGKSELRSTSMRNPRHTALDLDTWAPT